LNENIPGKQEEMPLILVEVYDSDDEEDENKIELNS
jgi:hypothetical protein